MAGISALTSSAAGATGHTPASKRAGTIVRKAPSRGAWFACIMILAGTRGSASPPHWSGELPGLAFRLSSLPSAVATRLRHSDGFSPSSPSISCGFPPPPGCSPARRQARRYAPYLTIITPALQAPFSFACHRKSPADSGRAW